MYPTRRNEKTAWRSHDVTVLRMRLVTGGGSALAALPRYLDFTIQFGRPQVGTLASLVEILRAFPVSEGWYIGGGVFVKSPLLYRFLCHFLVRTQESEYIDLKSY